MAKLQLDPLHKPTFCLYFQGSSYKCKERCIEGNRSVTVERHVHGDQPLRKQPEHQYPSIYPSIYLNGGDATQTCPEKVDCCSILISINIFLFVFFLFFEDTFFCVSPCMQCGEDRTFQNPKEEVSFVGA